MDYDTAEATRPCAPECVDARFVPLAEHWQELVPGRAEILLVCGGEMLLALRECTLRLPAGAVMVRDPRQGARVRRASGAAMLVSIELLPDPSRGASPMPVIHSADAAMTAAIRQFGERFGEGIEPEDARVRAAQACAALIAAEREWLPLIGCCSGRSFERQREQFLRLARARAVLEFGDAADLDLQRVAEIARLSTNYFIHQFRQVFGLSPHRYRIERRMLLARALITGTRAPIGHILRRLGLDSHSTFTRMFRRQFGVSASLLRAEPDEDDIALHTGS